MKIKTLKTSLWLSLILFIFSVAFLFTWDVFHLASGQKVNTYHRFQKSEDGKHKQFNWWALLSPVQTESQHVLDDTIRFTHKVVYPIGPHFELVPPTTDQ